MPRSPVAAAHSVTATASVTLTGRSAHRSTATRTSNAGYTCAASASHAMPNQRRSLMRTGGIEYASGRASSAAVSAVPATPATTVAAASAHAADSPALVQMRAAPCAATAFARPARASSATSKSSLIA